MGARVRNQVASVVAAVAVYLGGFTAVELIFHGIYYFYRQGWVLGAPVIAPAVASNVMITPGPAFPHAPPQCLRAWRRRRRRCARQPEIILGVGFYQQIQT